MLIQLHIENVAVISQSDIEFTEGFNVLTGETGAGKSIIIDSINAVLGERSSKDIIRTGAKKAKISATFNKIDNEIIDKLSGVGINLEDDLLILYREISDDGRSVFRINGQIVPMSIVKQIASNLINIHGQHDNQQLLTPSKHISFIDGYANLTQNVEQYKKIYAELTDVRGKLNSFNEDIELKARKAELLQFQIHEIESAELTDGEEEELLNRRDIIKNSESLSQCISIVHDLLIGSDDYDGAIASVKQISNNLADISEYLNDFKDVSERANSISYELEEILNEIRSVDGRFDFNPQELDQIEERLDIIFRLKQKYGNTIADILNKLDSLNKEFQELNYSEEYKDELTKKEALLYKDAYSKAEELSKIRLKAAEKLCNSVMQELSFLDMPNVKFAIEHNKVELKSDGFDQIEFLISANSGEILKPLSKIASGGELSRIMLAIKTVLCDSDSVDTMIFDEIDTGVSGKTARKIGEKIHNIASKKQVLCVTHLAQIASLADNHLLIEKKSTKDSTFTSVKALEYSEKVAEIARIMGGEIITEATLKAAEELISK